MSMKVESLWEVPMLLMTSCVTPHLRNVYTSCGNLDSDTDRLYSSSLIGRESLDINKGLKS